MRIVVLDGYTVSHGDISWDEWRGLGDFALYERSAPEEVEARLRDTEVAITNKARIAPEVMTRLPRLRYVGVLATGYDVVDTAAADSLGITVTNVPAYSTMSVAQMVFAHLLNVTNHVAEHSQSVAQGQWERAEDFCYSLCTLTELEGQTFGIVGMGNTGQAVARVAQALGMRVLALSRKSEEELHALGGAEKASTVDELFARADVVSLHCPLNTETHHLVNEARLSLMRPSAILINTARGGLVDSRALANALNGGRLRAACLDVLEEEPPREGNPLIGARGCHITPHIAWATQEARRRLMGVALENVKAFLRGEVRNRVNNPREL